MFSVYSFEVFLSIPSKRATNLILKIPKPLNVSECTGKEQLSEQPMPEIIVLILLILSHV